MRFPSRFVGLLACAALVQSAGSARAETLLTTVRVAEGLTRPAFVTAAPGDTARLFILEQRGSDARGRIKILKHGVLLARPFLTTAPLSTGFEQGLLGLAFAPNYAVTGRFYINYTRADGTTIVERHTVSADPDSANPAGTEILTVPQPYDNHNGGWLGFGPDGYLYIALGDGGFGGDPGDRAQNLNSRLGKLLRIDVSGATFSIPPTNPFAGATPGLDEIWAYGLRNPWRPAFDRATGDLVIADVGQGQLEEIDFQPAASAGGENYGWRCYEGSAFFSESSTTPCGSCLAAGCPKVAPAHEYPHTLSRCSVTGGYVYRGDSIPDLVGTYFFADYCAGKIYSGRFVGDTLVFVHDRTVELAPGGGLSIGSITSFGEDAAGELYICDQEGEVFKIVPGAVTGVEAEPRGASSRRLFLRTIPFRHELGLVLKMGPPERVRLDVFDVQGRRIRTILDGQVPSGEHDLVWDGRTRSGTDAPAGIYFVRLQGETRGEVLRAVRLR
jgi:glucose/arabinose dehydrogenase